MNVAKPEAFNTIYSLTYFVFASVSVYVCAGSKVGCKQSLARLYRLSQVFTLKYSQRVNISRSYISTIEIVQ